ncbi:MAG TPA: response regulator [Pirellulales bacterium]|nr:response regulator [Pirellulales bacterium]
MTVPTVFVVDGEHDARQSTYELLRANGHAVTLFSTPGAFDQAYSPGEAGCLVLDISLPNLSGLALLQSLSRRSIGLPVIAVSGEATTRMAVDAIKQGAMEFIEKPICPVTLLAQVRYALDRDAENREREARIALTRQRLATLTMREREVFDLLVAAWSPKQIAARLGISPKTSDVHRARVLAKMHVESVVKLARVAHRVGLLQEAE